MAEELHRGPAVCNAIGRQVPGREARKQPTQKEAEAVKWTETHVWIRRADFDVFKRLAIWTVFPSHADRNFIHGRLDNLVVFHVENRFPEIKFGFDGHGIVFVLGFSVSAPFHNQPTPVKPCRFRVCV